MTRDPKAKTFDGKYTMQKWWALSEAAERQSIDSYRPFIKPYDLVFDIGANRGRKTMIFRWLGAKVIAVEPLFQFGDEFVPEFWWKFGDDEYVTAVPKAVSDQREILLQINRNMPYVSSVDVPWMTESAHAKPGQPYYAKPALIPRLVSCITLDGLINIYGMPRFVKVDVEGHEDQAIQTLSTPVPALNMEFHQDWIPREAIAHVDMLAPYMWNYCLDNRGQFVLPEWSGSKTVLAHMAKNLTKEGRGSWGDLYAKRTTLD